MISTEPNRSCACAWEGTLYVLAQGGEAAQAAVAAKAAAAGLSGGSQSGMGVVLADVSLGRVHEDGVFRFRVRVSLGKNQWSVNRRYSVRLSKKWVLELVQCLTQ